MKKVLLGILAILVVILGGVWIYLDRIAQAAVERGGTRALGVQVTVASMALSPFSGRFGMDGFRVANPGGFSDQPVLQLDSGRVAVRLGSLFDEVVTIPEIMLDGLHVRLERNKKGTNLKRLLDNLDTSAGDETATSGGEAGSGGQTRVQVNQLRITNTRASVDLGPEFGDRGRFDLKLPAIELRNIGTEGNGVTVEQLVDRVTRAVVREIEESGARQLPDRIRRELRQRLDQEKQAIESEAKEAVNREKEKLKDKLEDEANKLFD